MTVNSSEEDNAHNPMVQGFACYGSEETRPQHKKTLCSIYENQAVFREMAQFFGELEGALQAAAPQARFFSSEKVVLANRFRVVSGHAKEMCRYLGETFPQLADEGWFTLDYHPAAFDKESYAKMATMHPHPTDQKHSIPGRIFSSSPVMTSANAVNFTLGIFDSKFAEKVLFLLPEPLQKRGIALTKTFDALELLGLVEASPDAFEAVYEDRKAWVNDRETEAKNDRIERERQAVKRRLEAGTGLALPPQSVTAPESGETLPMQVSFLPDATLPASPPDAIVPMIGTAADQAKNEVPQAPVENIAAVAATAGARAPIPVPNPVLDAQLVKTITKIFYRSDSGKHDAVNQDGDKTAADKIRAESEEPKNRDRSK